MRVEFPGRSEYHVLSYQAPERPRETSGTRKPRLERSSVTSRVALRQLKSARTDAMMS